MFHEPYFAPLSPNARPAKSSTLVGGHAPPPASPTTGLKGGMWHSSPPLMRPGTPKGIRKHTSPSFKRSPRTKRVSVIDKPLESPDLEILQEASNKQNIISPKRTATKKKSPLQVRAAAAPALSQQFGNLINPIRLFSRNPRGSTIQELEEEELRARVLQKELRTAHEIVPHLYLSGRYPAATKSILQSLGITHILVAAADESPKFLDEFVYHHIHVFDRPEENISQHFESCSNFIDAAIKSGGTVLVHCSAGVSRSVSIITAYLVRSRSVTVSYALQVIKSKRTIANPNPSFQIQLEQYQKLKERERGELSLLDEIALLASQFFSFTPNEVELRQAINKSDR